MWEFQTDIIRRRYFSKVVWIYHVTTSGTCSLEGRREAAVQPLPYDNDGIHVQGVPRALAHQVLWPGS